VARRGRPSRGAAQPPPELVEELWDSIAAEREMEPFPLTEAQRQELDRRLRELDEHPERARPWEEVRERLWARKRE
jgi:putative addiction module component (TIGR02574 family)